LCGQSSRKVSLANNTEIKNLKANLVTAGFRASPPWYIGMKYLNFYPRRNQFLLDMAQRGEELILQIAQFFWAFFEEMRNTVMQINAVLAS
jgi:hypothetical protein